MGTRILIQLAESETAKGELPAEVNEVLAGAGATAIRSSHRELPGLYTASLPAGADIDAVLGRLKAIPCVRHAQTDQFRSTL
jgi:hypothetical protein